MENIISRLYALIKGTSNLMDLEESIQLYMYDVFASQMGKMFTQINQVIKAEKQKQGWKVEREDEKTVQFVFGAIRFRRTLMRDEKGHTRYPFDEWIGLRKSQRYSPLVEVKTAELASESTYRATAKTLREWTSVTMSHQTVGSIVKRVGKAQEKADEEMAAEMEEAAYLPEGKKVDYLYAEADGVFVRGTKKKESHEVCHAILYEGWKTNGKRVSIVKQKVQMTTKPVDHFWKEVQASSAGQYALEKTQVITNSDGGPGYTSERFQETFSQSRYPVINQLDAYHVAQALNKAFGAENSQYKKEIKKALKERDQAHFTLWMDTYESTRVDEKEIKKTKTFRKYIESNWARIFDWRDRHEDPPPGARRLGAMESNQRHLSYRMKRRGMHWSQAGAEAMVKIIQGMRNQTLRGIYLKRQKRSTRKQREIEKTVRMTQILSQPTRPSVGAKQGSISLYTANSSARGRLKKIFG